MPMMPKPRRKPPANHPAVLISKELQTVADELSQRLNGIAMQPVSWSLFVWTEGVANYVAAADRAQIIPVLEAMIERWKEGMPDIPAHDRQ
jgi:hypothetical protein